MKPFTWSHLIFWFALGSRALAGANSIELIVDASRDGGEISLTRYALGQGGLSEKPMFDPHVEQIAQLRPQTIRVFIQEYFNLYPDHGRYHWDTFDKFMETILATGAKPILSLCFKPQVLFPKIDQQIVHPANYDEWEKLIIRLVKHCNEEKQFGIEITFAIFMWTRRSSRKFYPDRGLRLWRAGGIQCRSTTDFGTTRDA